MDTARNFELAIIASEWDRQKKKKVPQKITFQNGTIELVDNWEYRVLFTSNKETVAYLEMPELDILISEDGSKSPAPPDKTSWKNGKRQSIQVSKPVKSAEELLKYSFQMVMRRKDEKEYESLRVGKFSAKVTCDNEEYSFTIQVIPNKKLWGSDTSEDAKNKWHVMCTEVEKASQGLAQDLVRRSLGLEDEAANALTAEKLYRFLIIRQYSSRVLGALLGIQNAPKNRILTQYVALPEGKSCKADAKSMRMTAVSGERKQCVYAPRKTISYDIPENRLLKKIITFYDRELFDFYWRIQKSIEYRNRLKQSYDTKQQIAATEKNLDSLKKEVGRLRQISGIIKSQPWYDQIQNVPDVEPSHAVAMDPRYSVLLQMYQALKQEKLRCRENAKLDFSWKPSCDIYEMWCFLKVYHALRDSSENWKWDISGNDLALDCNTLFPSLEPGTSIRFTNAKYPLNGQTHNLAVELIYNREIGVNSHKDKDPFYYATGSDKKAHPLPDIRLDLYERFGKEPQKYYGTLILECKYRRTSSFWNESSDRSSHEQIQFYYTHSRTEWMYIPPQRDTQRGPFLSVKRYPVKRVIVLTPDTKRPNDAVPGFVDFLPLKPGLGSPLKSILGQFIDEQLGLGYYIDSKKTQH